MTDFLVAIEHLFSPIDAWGEFRRGARPAAVAFVLFERDGAWKVPFVRRRADLPDHPGQVALPGGGVRAGETAWDAAEREVAEEIGVPAGVIEIALDRLLDDSAWLVSDAPWRFRYLAHEESVVWGLTERIFYGLAPRLREALSGSGHAAG